MLYQSTLRVNDSRLTNDQDRHCGVFEEIFLANIFSEKSSSTAVQLTQLILMLKPDGAFN